MRKEKKITQVVVSAVPSGWKALRAEGLAGYGVTLPVGGCAPLHRTLDAKSDQASQRISLSSSRGEGREESTLLVTQSSSPWGSAQRGLQATGTFEPAPS